MDFSDLAQSCKIYNEFSEKISADLSVCKVELFTGSSVTGILLY